MKQSRSKVAREIGSPRGGLLPETTRGVYVPDARFPLKETCANHTRRGSFVSIELDQFLRTYAPSLNRADPSSQRSVTPFAFVSDNCIVDSVIGIIKLNGVVLYELLRATLLIVAAVVGVTIII